MGYSENKSADPKPDANQNNGGKLMENQEKVKENLEHSPLKISELSDDTRTLIENKDGKLVLCTLGDKYFEFADLIVNAVNSHEALVEALEMIRYKINLASHETPFKKAKRLGEFEEIINKALADAGRPQ